MVMLHILGVNNNRIHTSCGGQHRLAPVAVTVAFAADPLGQVLFRGKGLAVGLPYLPVVDEVQVAKVVLKRLEVVVKVLLGKNLFGVALFVALVEELVPVHNTVGRVVVGVGVLVTFRGFGLGFDLGRRLFPLVQGLAGAWSLGLQLFGFSHNSMFVLHSGNVFVDCILSPPEETSIIFCYLHNS